MNRKNSILKAENLHVKFGDNVVLKNFCLDFNEGQIIGLIGPNGCGKSTFLNVVSGFVQSEEGSLVFKENDITKLKPFERSKIGIGRSFQAAGCFREMTVEENLIISIEQVQGLPWWWQFSKKIKKNVDKQIDDLLKEINLSGHKKTLAGCLSGGQLRILELLRLKIAGGDLLLIDEPTAGVSPAMRQTLASMIKELAKQKGRTIVIVEHDMKFLFNLVDRVVVMVDGTVYLDDKPEIVQQDERLQEVYFGK